MIEALTQKQLNVLKKQDWSEKETKEGTIKYTFMQELIKKDLEEINNDLELLTAARISYSNLEAKYEIPNNEILEILTNPNLFNDITETELDKKIVGEVETRKVILLCAAGGRLVNNSQVASFNLLVNDDAGTGKDYVTGNTLSILPKEIYIHKTRISPTVFTYWHNSKSEPNWDWDGKVFYPEDISEQVLNSDVFKVMCSSGSSATITIRNKPVEIEIKGKPVMITTTATATPNPELARRFVILNLDSSEDQTNAIMKRHSEFKKNGIMPQYNQVYTEAMKFLKRVKVKIPFADFIDTYFPKNNIIMRTHYPRFLDFICASAAFHQYQREQDKDGFILAKEQDYNIARECFLKLCSNRFMIPLTRNQKKILEVFERDKGLKGSLTHLSPLINFLSEKGLQNNLQILVRYGILETINEPDNWNRDMVVYRLSKSYNPNEKINIPLFEELSNIALIPSETSISSEPSTPTERIEDIEVIKIK